MYVCIRIGNDRMSSTTCQWEKNMLHLSLCLNGCNPPLQWSMMAQLYCENYGVKTGLPVLFFSHRSLFVVLFFSPSLAPFLDLHCQSPVCWTLTLVNKRQSGTSWPALDLVGEMWVVFFVAVCLWSRMTFPDLWLEAELAASLLNKC